MWWHIGILVWKIMWLDKGNKKWRMIKLLLKNFITVQVVRNFMNTVMMDIKLWTENYVFTAGKCKRRKRKLLEKWQQGICKYAMNVIQNMSWVLFKSSESCSFFIWEDWKIMRSVNGKSDWNGSAFFADPWKENLRSWYVQRFTPSWHWTNHVCSCLPARESLKDWGVGELAWWGSRGNIPLAVWQRHGLNIFACSCMHRRSRHSLAELTPMKLV